MLAGTSDVVLTVSDVVAVRVGLPAGSVVPIVVSMTDVDVGAVGAVGGGTQKIVRETVLPSIPTA